MGCETRTRDGQHRGLRGRQQISAAAFMPNDFVSVQFLAERARETAVRMMMVSLEEAKTANSPALPRFACDPCSAFDVDIYITGQLRRKRVPASDASHPRPAVIKYLPQTKPCPLSGATSPRSPRMQEYHRPRQQFVGVNATTTLHLALAQHPNQGLRRASRQGPCVVTAVTRSQPEGVRPLPR